MAAKSRKGSGGKATKTTKAIKSNKENRKPSGWRVSASPTGDDRLSFATADWTRQIHMPHMPHMPPEPPSPRRLVSENEMRRYALGSTSIPTVSGVDWDRHRRSVLAEARHAEQQARRSATLGRTAAIAATAATAARSAGSLSTNPGTGTPATTPQARQAQNSNPRRGAQTPERAGAPTARRNVQAASPTRGPRQRGLDRAHGQTYQDVVRAAREHVAEVHRQTLARQTLARRTLARPAPAATTSHTVANEAGPAETPSSTGLDRDVGQQSAASVSPREAGAAGTPRAPPITPTNKRRGTRGIARTLPPRLRPIAQAEPQRPSARDLRAAARTAARTEPPDTPSPKSETAGRAAEPRESSRRSHVPAAEHPGHGNSARMAERIRRPSGRRNIDRDDVFGDGHRPARSAEPSNKQKTASQSQSQSQSQAPKKMVTRDLQADRSKTQTATRGSGDRKTSLEPPNTSESRESGRSRRSRTPQNPARQRDEPDVRYLWPASAPPPPMWMPPRRLRELGEAGISVRQRNEIDLAYDPAATAWIDRHYRTGHRENGLFEQTDAASPQGTTRSRLLDMIGHTGDSDRLRADRERTRRANSSLSRLEQLELWVQYNERLSAVEDGRPPEPGQTLMTRQELKDWWDELDPMEILATVSLPSPTDGHSSHGDTHPDTPSGDRQRRGRTQGGQETPAERGSRRPRPAAAAAEAGTRPRPRNDHPSTEHDSNRTGRAANPAGASFEDSVAEFMAEGSKDPWQVARDPASPRDS